MPTTEAMDPLVMIVGVPLAAILAAGIGLHFLSSGWVIRVSTAAIGTQVVLTLLAWLMLATMPGKQNGRESLGSTCPDLDGTQGGLLAVVAYGSVGVGAIALAASFIGVRRRAAAPGRLLAGIAAAALVFAIFIPILLAAFCGFG